MVTRKSAIEARQGENSRRMPLVLALSIALIVIGFASVYGYDQMFGPKQNNNASSNAASKP